MLTQMLDDPLPPHISKEALDRLFYNASQVKLAATCPVIAGNFREHKLSRITNKHARKKISRFLFSRQGHDIRPHPLQFPAWKW